MVKERYICGVCGKDYRTLDSAVACEQRGVEGIYIPSGLVVRQPDREYFLIVTRNEIEGHKRLYNVLFIDLALDYFARCLRKKDVQEQATFLRGFSSQDLEAGTIASFLADGKYRFLTAREYGRFCDLTAKARENEHIRAQFILADMSSFIHRCPELERVVKRKNQN